MYIYSTTALIAKSIVYCLVSGTRCLSVSPPLPPPPGTGSTHQTPPTTQPLHGNLRYIPRPIIFTEVKSDPFDNTNISEYLSIETLESSCYVSSTSCINVKNIKWTDKSTTSLDMLDFKVI